MLVKYIPIDIIFNKVNKIKPDGFNEIDIVDWTAEALEHIGAVRIYEEAVCYTEVKNFQCLVPKWTHNIIQIAKDRNFISPEVSTGICPIDFTSEGEDNDGVDPVSIPDCYNLPDGDQYPIIINQLGQPLTDFELAYYRPFFNLKYDYLSWINSSLYQGRFIPIKLATHSFFNTVVCQSGRDSIPYNSCEYEYNIIGGEILRFNFEEGGVVISYNRQQIDSTTGYPLIIDNVSVISAIIEYIRFQYAKADFYDYRQGSEGRLQKAEADWQWYCKQASNKLKMPSSVDQYQNLKEGLNYLVPREHYYGFFGYAGKQEKRNYLKS